MGNKKRARNGVNRQRTRKPSSPRIVDLRQNPTSQQLTVAAMLDIWLEALINISDDYTSPMPAGAAVSPWQASIAGDAAAADFEFTHSRFGGGATEPVSLTRVAEMTGLNITQVAAALGLLSRAGIFRWVAAESNLYRVESNFNSSSKLRRLLARHKDEVGDHIFMRKPRLDPSSEETSQWGLSWWLDEHGKPMPPPSSRSRSAVAERARVHALRDAEGGLFDHQVEFLLKQEPWAAWDMLQLANALECLLCYPELDSIFTGLAIDTHKTIKLLISESQNRLSQDQEPIPQEAAAAQ